MGRYSRPEQLPAASGNMFLTWLSAILGQVIYREEMWSHLFKTDIKVVIKKME